MGMEEQLMLTIPVLCDDLWHPADVIERGLSLFDQVRYQFDFIRESGSGRFR